MVPCKIFAWNQQPQSSPLLPAFPQELDLASAQPLPGAIVRQRHAEAADLVFG